VYIFVYANAKLNPFSSSRRQSRCGARPLPASLGTSRPGMAAAGIAILCSRCCSAWRCQQSRPGEDTSCTVVVDAPRRSDSLQYATALATASAHSRAVSWTAAPTRSPLGASSCCCFVLGTCVRVRHSSFLAPKHSGEAEVFLCPDVMKLRWSVLDEEDEYVAADGEETEPAS
jgi:hypothetical protein